MTTCVAPREDWFLRAEKIDIDTAKKVGVARDARLDFMGVPILYSPWLEFPLSNERKSGFLTPTLGSSGTRGIDFALPYYFNLAPNYDATVTPRIMTKRGVQIGGELRYLFSDVAMPNQGQAYVEVLPDDRQTDTTRWLYSWRHNQQITPWLAGYFNLNKVSDDTYFADLSERVAITSQSTLAREGGFAATFGPLSLLARAREVPDAAGPERADHAALQPRAADPRDACRRSSGGASRSRASASTRASSGPAPRRPTAIAQCSIRRSNGGGRARTGRSPRAAACTRGNTTSRRRSPTASDSPNVVVPIASLDGGLVFERPWKAFGTDFIQTLEPRAFYVYIPYRDQNQLPVFDTALDDFNFSQLFTENRYVGNDRIGDANQLTLAVTSRLLDPSNGSERMRFAIGQRFYFEDQRVILPNEMPRSSSSSDMLLGAEGRLSDAWLLNGLVQFNLDSGNTERLNLGARWMPEPGKVIAGSYRYTRQLVDPVGSVNNLQAVRHRDAVADHAAVDDARALELLAGAEQDAGGAGGL